MLLRFFKANKWSHLLAFCLFVSFSLSSCRSDKVIDGQRMTHQVQFGIEHCFWYASPKERAFLDKANVATYAPYQKLGDNQLILSKHIYAGNSFYCAIAQQSLPARDLPKHLPATWRVLNQDSIPDKEGTIYVLNLATPHGYLFRMALNEREQDLLLVVDAPVQDSLQAAQLYQQRQTWAQRLIP